MNVKALIVASVLAVALGLAPAAHAQVTIKEDFTNSTTDNPWFFFQGACLTAGSSTSTTSPGVTIPGCATVGQSFYPAPPNSPADTYMLGGSLGFLGQSNTPSSMAGQTPDNPGNGTTIPGVGALRFTNGSYKDSNGKYHFGFNERGAIVSAGAPFPTGAGVQITFKTITYGGNAGGNGGDGADGISFYLLDGCMPITGGSDSVVLGSGVPAECATTPSAYAKIYGSAGATFPGIGAFGGSLAYTCSNTNSPHDGLVGAYLALGIDEFGNFLNGATNTLLETGSTIASTYGDNTATGGYYQPGRIGLRGAGAIAWQSLNMAYGTSQGATYPYYPSTLSNACASGTLNSAGTACLNACPSPSSGTGWLTNGSGYNVTGSNAGKCSVCPSNSTYFPGATTSATACGKCASGYTFNPLNGTCTNSSSLASGTVTWSAQTTQSPVSPNPAPQDLRQAAVQATCETGMLYHFPDNSLTPTASTPATFNNTLNPAGILDYPAIGTTVNSSAQGYNTVSSSTPIASESATTRNSPATPIAYNLKITQDGLLSLSYSYGGGSAIQVIQNQSITASNGPLPSVLRFGFAGSTGGSTNIHEIICFKAAPVQTGNGSGGVNVFQDPTLKSGAELFLASYFPSDWTGSVTATKIIFNGTALALAPGPSWDASCVLTLGACASTGTTTSTPEAPGSRIMVTWNGTKGIPFEWGSLSTAEQNALDFGDSSVTSDRLQYLRGVTTNEVNKLGVGEFRHRDRILGDIIDSSPNWVGPPSEPYVSMTSWVDSLYATAQPPENSGTQTYLQYQQSKQGRLNVVYVGANDGFLHGFRAGTLDVNGNLISTTALPNDGQEVFAYMPGVVLGTIHPTQTIGGVTTVNTAADYSNTQYSHAYFVDATPTTGDLFYGGTWHTWVVGGLGAGGAAIYAIDVSDPGDGTAGDLGKFDNEADAASLVIGEWTPSNLVCANDSTLPAPCKNYLGNTYGTPEIRRFHNGDWGVIFGNGYGDLDTSSKTPGNPGAAGIFIMLIDSTSGTPTFYYLPATPSASGALVNGIGSPTSLDVDLDHIIDYIYAGDLRGNVWKFDVTSTDPTQWGKTASSPLFTAPNTPAIPASGGNAAVAAAPSPITTRLQVGTLKSIGTSVNGLNVTVSNAPERIIINFGTGQAIPQTVAAAAQYANGPQYLYGIWDWDFGAPSTTGGQPPAGSWNALSPNQQAIALAGPQTIAGPGPGTNLQAQTITPTTLGTGSNTTVVRSMSHKVICWKGDSGCGGGSSQTQFGWFIQLPGTNEQVIFDPTYSPEGEFVVNTYVPAVNSVLSCSIAAATGFSMGLDPLTGGGSPTPFFNVGGTGYDGIQLNGTGTPSFLSSGHAEDSNAEYLLTQTTAGTPAAPQQVNRNAIVTGQRLNWIQRR